MSPKLFLVPAVAAAMLVCAACEKRPDQAAQTDTSATSSTTAAAKYSSEEMAKGQRVSEVANPQTTLASASVENEQGESLGSIKSITVASDGKASAVNIEVASVSGTGNKTVAVDASKFTYLPEKNVLVASLGKSDLETMPEAPAQQ